MTPEEVQLWTALGGFATTLGGVALANWFSAANEKRRIQAEDRRRWHEQRFKTVSDLIAIFMRVDNELISLADALPEDVGGTEAIFRESLLTEDAEGNKHLMEPAWIERLQKDARAVISELDDAHRLVVELSVVASGQVVEHAWSVLQGYSDAARAVKEFSTYEEATAPLVDARIEQKKFVIEARSVLGADIHPSDAVIPSS